MSKKTVALFLTRQDESQKQWAAETRREADRRGLTLIEYWADEAIVQNRQISECVWNDKADALVILAASIASPAAILREAASRGKDLVLLARTSHDTSPTEPWSLSRLRQDFTNVLVAAVVPDEKEIGRIQGRQFRALLPGGGNILYVQGDTMTTAVADRTSGMEEVIGGDHSYRVGKVDGGFNESKAEKATREWLSIMLRTPEYQLHLIGSQSEVMIPGIRHALDRLAREFDRSDLLGIPITGVDATPEYKKEVSQGKLAATVEVPPRTSLSISLLSEFWQNGAKPQDLVTYLTPTSFPLLDNLRPRAR